MYSTCSLRSHYVQDTTLGTRATPVHKAEIPALLETENNQHKEVKYIVYMKINAVGKNKDEEQEHQSESGDLLF